MTINRRGERHADSIMKGMSLGRLGPERQQQLRDSGLRWVRRWQQQFPEVTSDGDKLDLNEPMVQLLAPQTDMFVRRPGRFAIRVRPDNVVGIGQVLVAWEWSTAKNPEAISRARFALNHHALLRERFRRPEWLPLYGRLHSSRDVGTGKRRDICKSCGLSRSRVTRRTAGLRAQSGLAPRRLAQRERARPGGVR
jgi:hypothetical protein